MSQLISDPGDARSGAQHDGEPLLALRIVLRGRVQGLGVRPSIARLASSMCLSGAVSNSLEGVAIHVEGPSESVRRFQQCLTQKLPPRAEVTHVAAEETMCAGAGGFHIELSQDDGPLVARVPLDLVVCDRCLADAASTANRRHGYLLTTCTACGPRYSLIRAMPYDREATEMRRFALCPECSQEYSRPSDRRFHSQTNACRECGPQLSLSEADRFLTTTAEDILLPAIAALRAGRILAVRGIGGYQLLVDATSPAAVGELRRRKMRLGKPLAVLVEGLDAVHRLAIVNAIEREQLCSPQNPIVVLTSKTGSPIVAEISEGLDTLGVMLPTTPLHFELVRTCGAPLIVTSGNLEGDPLAFESDAARHALGSVADLWLDHDRPIARPVDDSVVRVIAGKPATLRLGRGLAPLPLELNCRPMLALGGHQNAAIALSNGVQSVLGPHIGDLDVDSARDRYLEQIQAMCQLYGVAPEMLVCDQHPDYFSTRWATEQPIPTMAVQHHHAHVAAAMLERGWLGRKVLGIAWDGTGYGPDGTVWGGEFLIASATRYRRVACLRPFVLPGGEAAVRQPWRVAASLVYQAVGPVEAAKLRFDGIDRSEVEQLVRLLSKPRLWPTTSSAGRLFDGVAALALGITTSQFEGQPAMLLEAACDPRSDGQYALPLDSRETQTLDWRSLVAGVLSDRSAGLSPRTIATRFHRALAAGIVTVAERFRLPVVLCGGCFYNKMLTELVVDRLPRGRELVTPGVVPSGDGGLAAGQLAICSSRRSRGWPACA